MNSTVMLIVALILLPAVCLATWAWGAIAQVEGQLRSFCGYEGMHFETGPQAANEPEKAR